MIIITTHNYIDIKLLHHIQMTMNFTNIQTYQDVIKDLQKHKSSFKICQHNNWFSINYKLPPKEMKYNKCLQELRGIKFFGNYKEQEPSECAIMSRMLHKFYNIEQTGHDYETHPINKAEMYIKYDGYLLQFHLFKDEKPVSYYNIKDYDINELQLVPLTKMSYQKDLIGGNDLSILKKRFNTKDVYNKDKYFEYALHKDAYDYLKLCTYNSIKENKSFIYEFVRPNFNYNKTDDIKLVLVAIRHNTTGVYYKLPKFNFDGILFNMEKVKDVKMNDVKQWKDNEGVVAVWVDVKDGSNGYRDNIKDIDNKHKNSIKYNTSMNDNTQTSTYANEIYNMVNLVKIKSNVHIELDKFDTSNTMKMYRIILNNKLDDYTNKISKDSYDKILQLKDELYNKFKLHAKHLDELYKKYDDFDELKRNVKAVDKNIVSYKYKNNCTMYKALIAIVNDAQLRKKFIKCISKWKY